MTKVTNQPITVQEYEFDAAALTVKVWYTEAGQPKSKTVDARDFHTYLYFAGVGIAHTGGIADYFNIAPTRQLVIVDLTGFLEYEAAPITVTKEVIIPASRANYHPAPVVLENEIDLLYMRGLL